MPFDKETALALRRLGRESGLPDNEYLVYDLTTQYSRPKGRVVAHYLVVRFAGMDVVDLAMRGEDLWSEKNIAAMRKRFTRAAGVVKKVQGRLT